MLNQLLALKTNTALSAAASFFIYDVIKIGLLLLVIIFLVALLRSYLPPQKIKNLLVGRFQLLGNLLAALIGIVTPFCSCSAIPLFIGLIESGVPLGVAFSYLVSAPMVNEVAIVLLLSMFGWKIALAYVVSGVVLAVLTGVILGRFNLNHLIESETWKNKANNLLAPRDKDFKTRTVESLNYTLKLIRSIYPFVLIGIAIGALIHGYAPANLLSSLGGQTGWLAVPLAVLIGVPLYSNAAGTIPIIVPLIEKGLPIGTALSFMMAITALSAPEMIILRKVLKPKLLAIYATILTIGIILTGYLFNWLF